MTNDNQNPYAAPTLQPPLKPGEKHQTFQFTDRGIRFHNGLELPKICLVTGRSDSFLPRTVRLGWMSLNAKVVLFGSTVLIVLLGPVGFVFLKQYAGQNANPLLEKFLSMKNLPFIWVIAFYVVINMVVFFSPRGVVTAYIHSSIKQRIRRSMLDAMFVGLLVAAVVFLGAVLTLMSVELTPSVVVLVIGVCTVSGFVTGIWRWIRIRKCFCGLKLKVLGYDAGQFEVGGFTPEYLEALRTEIVGSQ